MEILAAAVPIRALLWGKVVGNERPRDRADRGARRRRASSRCSSPATPTPWPCRPGDRVVRRVLRARLRRPGQRLVGRRLAGRAPAGPPGHDRAAPADPVRAVHHRRHRRRGRQDGRLDAADRLDDADAVAAGRGRRAAVAARRRDRGRPWSRPCSWCGSAPGSTSARCCAPAAGSASARRSARPRTRRPRRLSRLGRRRSTQDVDAHAVPDLRRWVVAGARRPVVGDAWVLLTVRIPPIVGIWTVGPAPPAPPGTSRWPTPRCSPLSSRRPWRPSGRAGSPRSRPGWSATRSTSSPPTRPCARRPSSGC